MSRGHAAAFPAFDPTAAADAIDPLRFDVPLTVGRRTRSTVNLTRLSRPRLARAFAGALRDDLIAPGTACSVRTVAHRVRELLRFWQFLDETGELVETVEEIGPDLIDRYERWLAHTKCGGDINRRHYLARPIALLRRIEEHRPGTLRHQTVDRLAYLSLEPWVRSIPRDAYDGARTEMIRRAAREQVQEAASRIVLQGVPPVPEGLLPVVAERYAKVMIEVDQRGWLHSKDPVFDSLRQRALYWGAGPFRWEDIHGRFYLNIVDVVGFIALLALETGLETECLTRLKADCLKNPGKGTVEIEYYKLRARGAEWKRLRVRDGGTSTPGGLIRLALRLTERARGHKGTDLLWVFGCVFGLVAGLNHGSFAARYFVRKHKLKGDDGSPLQLELSRLRKTQKAEWYLKTNGQLDRFAIGHTPEVAANHYADIPALRHLHEQTVADAFQDALDDALAPRLVTPDEEAAIRADPAGAALPGVTPAETPAFLDGAQDLWLASCGGFYASPFGSAGQPCPVPFWGCLECRNAVITAAKLPALVAFLEFMALQREALSEADWAAKFGRAHRRIAQQILPAFPESTVVQARAIAAERTDLLYLPPEADAR